jgi:hypothetical protein
MSKARLSLCRLKCEYIWLKFKDRLLLLSCEYVVRNTNFVWSPAIKVRISPLHVAARSATKEDWPRWGMRPYTLEARRNRAKRCKRYSHFCGKLENILAQNVSFQTAEESGTGTILRSSDSATAKSGNCRGRGAAVHQVRGGPPDRAEIGMRVARHPKHRPIAQRRKMIRKGATDDALIPTTRAVFSLMIFPFAIKCRRGARTGRRRRLIPAPGRARG